MSDGPAFPKPVKKKKLRRELRSKRKVDYALARIRFFVQLATVQGTSVAMCEVCGEEAATQVHHKAGREGDDLTDINKFLGTCDGCQRHVHENPEWAFERGYMLRRNT